ncbi:MAG: N-acetyltransferase, partial [Actinomycetota bacterium]|nr:N-acetyltransferase [Actinomycetota bacterium]
VVGARCKIQNAAQVFEGARLGDGVFIGPGAILTNDRHPRAVTPDGRVKGVGDWNCEGVTVDDGASVGAASVVLAGVRLGAWSLVAAAAVVTRSVDAYELVAGIPAERVGWVCRCAARIEPPGACLACGRRYHLDDGHVVEAPEGAMGL